MSGRQIVRVFNVQDRRSGGRSKPWVVRWEVDGRRTSRAFRTKALADRYRSELVVAHDRGESFDRTTGEPLSWSPSGSDVTVYDWARTWLAEQWPEWQPRTRTSAVEALSRFVPLAVASNAGDAPVRLRNYLTSALQPDQSLDDIDECERWLRRASLPLVDLTRQNLAAIDSELGKSLDGGQLSSSTAGRYRKVARSCIRRAVELEVLGADPWPPQPKGRRHRKAVRTRSTVDIRKLPDPATMRRAIDAIETHQPASLTYKVMTAVAYYAGLRPSEVVMLRRSVLSLPANGWGRIDVVEADIDFDVPGEPKTGPRSVPIPPVLVDILSEWCDEHPVQPDELLFRTRTGNRPTASNWTRAWHRALRSIDHPTLRVYDCRHAAATTWLQAGVSLGEVARRLGHSVETLVKTYVGALASDEESANQRIEARLQPARGAASSD
jgi:integrase